MATVFTLLDLLPHLRAIFKPEYSVPEFFSQFNFKVDKRIKALRMEDNFADSYERGHFNLNVYYDHHLLSKVLSAIRIGILSFPDHKCITIYVTITYIP